MKWNLNRYGILVLKKMNIACSPLLRVIDLKLSNISLIEQIYVNNHTVNSTKEHPHYLSLYIKHNILSLDFVVEAINTFGVAIHLCTFVFTIL